MAPSNTTYVGPNRLVDEQGFTYRKDRFQARTNSITWRCTLEWKHKCKARAKTVNDVIVRINRLHNHEPQLPEQAQYPAQIDQ